MTAEIVILNRSAVALAADSRVTSLMNGNTDYKDGIDKIFALSDFHPVAIMVYNNMAFGDGVYWKDAIEAYREFKGQADEPTVAAWMEDFVVFIAAYGNVSAASKAENLKRMVEDLFAGIEERAERCARRDGCDPEVAFQKEVARLHGEPRLAALSAIEMDRVEQAHGGLVRRLARRPLAKGDGTIRSMCLDLAWRRLESDETSEMYTGLVLAGYGSTETYASLASLKTDGHLGPVFKVVRGEEVRLDTDGSRAAIAPFAQKDVADLFIQGASDDFVGRLADVVYAEMRGVLREAGRMLRHPVFHEELAMRVDDGLAKIFQTIGRLRNESAQDLIEHMRQLAAPGLADLAASLVNVTSVRRNYTLDDKTVGGTIRTAIIEKGGGKVKVVSRA